LVKQYLAGMQVEAKKMVSCGEPKHQTWRQNRLMDSMRFSENFSFMVASLMYSRASCLAAHQRTSHIKAICTWHLSARLSVRVVNSPEDFDLDLLQVFSGLG
jgi:hypothetical protein